MTGEMESQDLTIALDEVVSACGDRPAFRFADRALTYAELGAAIGDKRVAYDAAGIHSTSTVGVIADDAAEFLTDVFALLMLQAFAVLLPSGTTSWELERLSRHVRLSHVLSTAPLGPSSGPVGRARGLTRLGADTVPIGRGPRLGFLTSGTTGQSKVALRTGHAMLSEAVAVRRELSLTPGRRLAVMVPLHHSFGFGDCALTGMLAGAEVIGFPPMHPSAYLSGLERAAIDLVALVPSQLRLLAEACQHPSFGRLSAFSAGAPLDSRTAELATARLGCQVGQVYGTSETGVIAVAPAVEGGSAVVGKPSEHMEVRLESLPPGWDVASPAAGPEGIVTVRSPALFEGYVTLDGIDDRSLQTGWFSTGDCARWAEGRLQLLGRLSSAINVAGVKVSAEEVEAALLEFPAVRSALVTGVEDGLAHQRIKAYVTPEHVDLKALRHFCEAHLSPPQRPHYYEAVPALATTPSGKVIRGRGAVSTRLESPDPRNAR